MKPPRPPFEVAVRYLARSARTTHEVRTHLAKHAFGEQEIDETVEKLLSIGYLDDPSLARHEAERMDRQEMASQAAISEKLSRRGLGEDMPLSSGELTDEVTKAMAVAHRRRATSPEKLARHLAAKGFDEETVRTVVARLFPDLEL